MPHAGFVHLSVHSAYSLLEGAIKIPDLVALCRRHAMPAVAVTDSGNLFGALEFALAAVEAGVQPIVGCRIGLAREDDRPLGSPATRPAPDRIALLVQDRTGYRNLMKLVSRSFMETPPGEPAQVSLADLEAFGAGLIALGGGPAGPVGRRLLDGQDEAAEAALRDLARIFPGRLYVEVMRHGLAEEARIEDRLVDLAYALDLPLVATNEVFFAEAEMYEAHDALLCIAEGTYVGEAERRRLTPEHRFKSAAEMAELFADLPEAIANTLTVARRCAYVPEAVAPMLPAFPTEAGRSEAEELRTQSEAGLEGRLEEQVYTEGMDQAAREAAARSYRERLKYELEVIEQMGYPGYFLIVADFIQWAKRQGIPVGPGRGSGAGSVVSWALTITGLDPLRWGLLFERFLNPERVSMPDFDIDFCQERRDEVIRYVQEKYGRDHVAQIITFGKLQARAALRDVGRVLQMPYPQVDRICKLVPNNPANPVGLQEAIEGEPRLQEMRAEDPTVARLLDIALKVEGLYRHASTHAAGVVIGDRRLDELIPLYRDPRSDMAITQFSMKYVELAGLVKFDFLGLKTLSVLARACELIAERGTALDLSRIPLDDAGTYEMLARGDTVGVFQLESSGMRDVLKRLKADRFEDIIAVVALFRPGPMDNIPSFIARKHGLEAIDYLYPTLEGILKETFGIMIYQEQVMQIAQELAGYSLGGADLLRRAMGKKIRSEMEAQRKTFIQGAVARGVPETKAEQIFEQVNKFAGYGFNKSHAAAYALVAYQTAYLKANHPVEFLAASMTFDMGNTDKLNIFRQELDRLGIPLLPPDINRSRADFGVEEPGANGGGGRHAIRYALAAVKNVGRAAMDALVAERDRNGPFKSLGDLAERVDARAVNKRQIESLACAGAFDGLDGNRHRVFEAAETIARHASAAASERESAQENLFGNGDASVTPDLVPAEVADWPAMERLRHEFEAIGFYLSAHPLDAYGDSLERLGVVRAADLAAAMERDSGRKRLAGIVIDKRERTSRQGNRFAFVQLSDTSGVYEVVVFSDLLAATRDLLDGGEPLLLTVESRGDDEGLRLMAQKIEPLEAAVAGAGLGLRVFMSGPEPLESLKSLLERETEGRGHIKLVLDLADGQEVELELPGGYRLSPAARQAIKAVPGLVVQDV
ncbi:MAG: DNA polymerase III subunit alpha [Proteobacteria bacterium]|nr:DNA polymerase III subunit alpha [Pseudomonadota bacterium]